MAKPYPADPSARQGRSSLDCSSAASSSSSSLTGVHRPSGGPDPAAKEAEPGDPTDLVKAEDGGTTDGRGGGANTDDRRCRPKPETAPAKAWRWTKLVLQFLLDQWFVLGVGFVIGMAAAFPNVARPNGVLEAQWSIRYILVAIIFLVSGLTLPLRNLYLRLGDWKLHAVTQITSFFIFPSIVFAIINCVRAGDPNFERFDRYSLVGMMTMGVLPTTVSSNVVMTGQAGGDESAATIEVILGNLVGTFLSPALLEMFFVAQRWSFAKPVASGSGGTGEVYRQVIEQLGYTVFIPLFVGEVTQYIWPRQTKLVRMKLRLGKVGSLCLLGVIWSTFSGAFYENAFEILSGEAVAFVVTVDVGLYIVLSLFLFAVARLVPVPKIQLVRNADEKTRLASTGTGPLFDPETTIALLFCGAAKGAALGAPIVAIMYGGLPGSARGIVSLPLVLYQGSQVVLGQGTVAVLKAWHRRIKRRETADAERKVGEGGKGEVDGSDDAGIEARGQEGGEEEPVQRRGETGRS
ncbi:hypothetical protein JCM1841_005472 [Sporobolomyces salmonicolor]